MTEYAHSIQFVHYYSPAGSDPKISGGLFFSSCFCIACRSSCNSVCLLRSAYSVCSHYNSMCSLYSVFHHVFPLCSPPGIRRTTLILFLISLVYIVSFLPHLVMMTVKAIRPQAVAGDSDTWTVASNLIIRSYFLNSVANPFIYTFLSKNFVRRVRGSFSRWSRVRGRAGNRV